MTPFTVPRWRLGSLSGVLFAALSSCSGPNPLEITRPTRMVRTETYDVDPRITDNLESEWLPQEVIPAPSDANRAPFDYYLSLTPETAFGEKFHGDSSETDYRPPQPEEQDLDDLVCKVDQYLLQRWNRLGDGDRREEGDVDARRALGERLVGLSFLKKDSAAQEVPRAALETLLAGAGTNLRISLLLAAFYEKKGASEEREGILRAVFSQLAKSPQPTEDPGQSPWDEPLERDFRIEEAVFVSEIHGLDEYSARPDTQFLSGDRVLIYGEFSGFEQRLEALTEGAAYLRKFRASLRLVTSEDKVLYSGVFLPPDAGASSSPEPQTRVNFWAQYEFPEDLPPGEYRLEIVAQDLLGNRTARTSLPLTILNPEDDLPQVESR